MILPIGESEFDVQRLPWITFAVMCMCVVVSLVSPPSSPEAQPERSPVVEAAEYWSQHPYLIAEPEILVEVGRGLTQDERLAHLERLREASYARYPADEPTRASQQAQLDALTRQALEATLARSAEGPGLVPAAPNVTGALAHAFIHAGPWSLVANLLALLLMGAALEAVWREAVFAGFVALAVLFTGAFYWLMVPDSTVSLLGASALSSALLTACVVRYWAGGCRTHYFLWLGRPRVGTFIAPAWSFALLWLVIRGVTAWLPETGAIAYQADVGGLFFGAGAALALRHWQIRERVTLEAPELMPAGLSVLEEALEARAEGDTARAFSLLQGEVRGSQPSPEAVVAFWEVALESDRADAACPPMLTVIRECVARGELAAAARHWIDLTDIMPGARLDPETLVRLAPALLTLGDSNAALEVLRKAVDPRLGGMPGETAARAASLARDLGAPEIVAKAARIAVADQELDAFQRVRLREQIAEIEGPEAAATAGVESAAAPAGSPTQAPRPELPMRSEPAPQPRRAPPALDHDDGDTLADGVIDGVEATGNGETDTDPTTPTDPVSTDVLTPFSGVMALEAIPEMIGEASLSVRLVDDRMIEVEYDKIEALAAGGVLGLADQPVVVIDLALNWNGSGGGPLRVIRFRGDRFDPRHLVGDGVRRAEAFRVFLQELHTHANAVALPDPASARGKPMRVFESLAAYERKVLDVAD